MSKTIELQIEKSRVLIEGLSKNIGALTSKGITDSSLALANEECSRVREELSIKVKHMNSILTTVKEAFADKKRIIKTNYPQEHWIRYGVQDKR